MAATKPFTLIYARDVITHLKVIDRKYHSLIRLKIEEQLLYEPDIETDNRKPLIMPNALEVAWEVRFGPNNRFRVFYAVDRERHQVNILAVGTKSGNRLVVGREEIEL